MPRSLHLIDGLACGDGRGAQVVRCYLDENAEKIYVAKIYDPLYYEWKPWPRGECDDPTYSAESDYSSEAAAYEEIEKSGFNGNFSPAYFGSWTFEMPLLGSTITRQVRMILIEWIPGSSMGKLIDENNVDNIPPGQRLDILAKVLETESKLSFAGVNHDDFAPRNIILVGSNLEIEMPDVFLIDFGRSAVVGHPNARYPAKRRDLPFNPRDRFWLGRGDDLLDWAPISHQSAYDFRAWLMLRWGDDAEGFSSWPIEAREKFGTKVNVKNKE